MDAATLPFDLEPLDTSFGAVVTDVDLRSLDDASFDELYRCWLDHALLVFPGQHLDKDEQVRFARRFGDLVEGLEAATIRNVRRDGTCAFADIMRTANR